MTAAARNPIVAIATTIGRPHAVETLVSSLAPQLSAGDELVVVAQGSTEPIGAVLERLRPNVAGTITLTASPRGASRGRNAGVAASTSGAADPILIFPNDTSWFGERTLDAIRATVTDAPAAGFPVMADGRMRLKVPPGGTPLDERTVWSVIEMGLAIRRSLFDALGGFDVRIGTGSASPWQAGEVTDLLMRALTLRPSLRHEFVWGSHPDAWVGGVSEPAGLSVGERRWKLRAYGRGVGHVYRTHPFPAWQRWGFVAAGIAIGARRRDEYSLVDGVPALVGRLEGVTGHLVSRRRQNDAVTR